MSSHPQSSDVQSGQSLRCTRETTITRACPNGHPSGPGDGTLFGSHCPVCQQPFPIEKLGVTDEWTEPLPA